MKRILAAALCALLILSLFSGCAPRAGKNEKLQVVTTIFPIYDWVRQIAGNVPDLEVTLLLDNGVDLHSYQPTADDIIRISTCDLFIYVGGESDAWVKDALDAAVNKNMTVVNLMEELGDALKKEELSGSMEEEGEEGGEEAEYDEHVWLSLKNASFLCEKISEVLGNANPERSSAYKANAADYAARLSALDGQYRAAVAQGRVKQLIFADRFPFRYLTEDYGLEYDAAFSGCSAETGASFETVVSLAKQADAWGVKAILCLDGSDGSIARTVRDATAAKDQKILTLNSLQSATRRDAESGVTYLSVMEQNLAVLKEALE